jgi:hypothetical protein
MTLVNVTDHTIGLQVERNSSVSRTIRLWLIQRSNKHEAISRTFIYRPSNDSFGRDVGLRIVLRIKRGRQ